MPIGTLAAHLPARSNLVLPTDSFIRLRRPQTDETSRPLGIALPTRPPELDFLQGLHPCAPAGRRRLGDGRSEPDEHCFAIGRRANPTVPERRLRDPFSP